MRFGTKYLLLIIAVSATAVCCKKKTLHPLVVTLPVVGDTIYKQTAVHTDVNDNIGGFYEALPPSYSQMAGNYPLLIFLHGGGELGNGNDQLPAVLRNSIPKLLDKKSFPMSFAVSGQTFSFVIVSPQFKAWPKPADVDAMVDYAIGHYRIDTHRIYMVGLSMGGGATWEYAAQHGTRLAAMVPISGASWADSATARGIAVTNVPTWAFHNKDDSVVTYRSTTRYIDFIQYYSPAFPIRLTLWPSGGHDAWTKASDPLYKEDGKNIYEWMLQYVR